MKRVVCFFALSGILIFYGCAPEVKDVEEAELRDVYVRKAKSRIESGDKQEAIELLEQAIVRKPLNATAHLQLAMLYDTSATNFIKAIYHYQRYLELRPNAEKRTMVKELLKKAELNYLAGFSDQYKALEKEIASLREENTKLKMELASPSITKKDQPTLTSSESKKETMPVAVAVSEVASGTPSQTNTLPNKPATADNKRTESAKPIAEKAATQQHTIPPGATTYIVQPGDTLSKIAARFYQNPRLWKKIYEANKASLGVDAKLKKGQILIIPK